MKTITYKLYINEEEFREKLNQMIQDEELDPLCYNEEMEVLKALFFEHIEGYFGEIDHSNFKSGTSQLTLITEGEEYE